MCDPDDRPIRDFGDAVDHAWADSVEDRFNNLIKNN